MILAWISSVRFLLFLAVALLVLNQRGDAGLTFSQTPPAASVIVGVLTLPSPKLSWSRGIQPAWMSVPMVLIVSPHPVSECTRESCSSAAGRHLGILTHLWLRERKIPRSRKQFLHPPVRFYRCPASSSLSVSPTTVRARIIWGVSVFEEWPGSVLPKHCFPRDVPLEVPGGLSPQSPQSGVPCTKRFSPLLFALWSLNNPCQRLGVSTLPRRWLSIPRPARSSKWLPAHEAHPGISKAASLQPRVAPAWWDSASAGASESPQTPAHRLQPCLCQGEQILGAREGAESSFPFVLGVFSISNEQLPGEHLHTYLSWGFAWERSTILKGPRRPAQKLLHGGGSYCSSPDEVHKDFMPQTAPLVQD